MTETKPQIRIIYVRIDEKIESIEFNSNTSAEDLKEILRCAAEANPNDLLKLYNQKGNIVAINNSLAPNTAKDPYRLQVIVKNIVDYNNELKDFVDRIDQLELQLNSVSTTCEFKIVEDLHAKVKDLCLKLENFEHLRFIGLFKENPSLTLNSHVLAVPRNTIKPNNESRKERLQSVYEKFRKNLLSQVSDETRQYLRRPAFDNWKYEDAELLVFLQQIFLDLDLVARFSIRLEILQNYLFEIYSNYNDVPYHNFRHAFCVTQMIYCLICLTKLYNYLDPLEILALIVSAINHDLGHDGFNNNYQVNAKTDLAQIYNDYSPLEMYHCAVTFHILNKPNCNILAGLDKNLFKKFREFVIKIILATDMAIHIQVLESFTKIVDEFNFKNPEHRIILMKIFMKTSDISNECRPVSVAEAWLECMLNEFFNQGDHEKLNGLPVTPSMDRNNFSKSKSQIGFINFALLPLTENLAKIFPQLNSPIVKPVKDSLEHYRKMNN